MEYTAIGDASTTAARMAQNAPARGILITHDTYRHVRGVFDVQPQEPLLVKGKAQPVQTYVVLQAKERAFRETLRRIGRLEAERSGLRPILPSPSPLRYRARAKRTSGNAPSACKRSSASCASAAWWSGYMRAFQGYGDHFARSFGYGSREAWVRAVLPQIWRQVRLPVLAVLAYSLSVVDVALILGPGNPPTLAVLAVRWLGDADVRMWFPAAAAATLVLVVVAASIGVWLALERLVAAAGARIVARGRRKTALTPLAGGTAAIVAALGVLACAAMAGMALWSVATQWRFPGAMPSGLTLDGWFIPEAGARRTILICHGAGANKGNFIWFLGPLMNHGYSFLFFDFNTQPLRRFNNMF